MDTRELTFAIPTYRLRETSGRRSKSTTNISGRNGHTVRIVVFDDSIPVNQRHG